MLREWLLMGVRDLRDHFFYFDVPYTRRIVKKLRRRK